LEAIAKAQIPHGSDLVPSLMKRQKERADATEMQLRQVVLTLLGNGIAEAQIPMMTGLSVEQVERLLGF
jgi:hypothetical protein